jgi:hypothetical protein
MEFLPLIPALIAAWVAFFRSPSIAFLNVYLPVLFLLPMYYRWTIPVVPDPTFEQAAILPIAAAFFARAFRGWRWRITDFLMLGFVLSISYSEFINAGYKEAQNLTFEMFASVLLPYVLTRALVEPYGLRYKFARRVVMLAFAVSLSSLYEFRFGLSPWKYMDPLFPGQGLEWYTTFRYGLPRVAGPFGHPILAGLVLVIAFRIQRWLEWSGRWEPIFRTLPTFGVSKARVLTLGVLAGMIMTLCRGPWLGGFVGAAITNIGRARNRKRAAIVVAAGLVFIGVPAAVALYSYAAVGRARAVTAEQETAAYRKELLDKYYVVALQKPIWGYGRNTWPKIPTAPSVDNYYLLLTLMHGLVAVGFLVTIMGVTTIRLFRFEMRLPPSVPKGSSLGFTLAGIYVAIAVTIGTVYLGLQAVPLFAIITGWSEGYLCAAPDQASKMTPEKVATARPFAFRRVVA